MAVLSRSDGREKLSLWDVRDPSRITRMKSQYSNHDLQFTPSMRMDEKSMAIVTFQNETIAFVFFLKKTLQLLWQKTDDGNNNFLYGHGMLIVKQNYKSEEYGIIQVYDVTSGQCFREMRIMFPLNSGQLMGFNAMFMVVAESIREDSPDRSRSELKIYDLEAVKNPKSTEDELLVHTVALKSDIYRIFMDETLLICDCPFKTNL
jgi:hypothetical protein